MSTRIAGDDEESGFDRRYSDEGFWAKLARYAVAAGQAVVEKALALYYCALDPETPTWAKGIIYGALAYFIIPLDAIPDAIPVGGYSDDLGVLVAAIAAVASHLKDTHVDRAKETLKRWFT
jgi:uncharacterized membrane protein YkvA (DUF1232 family)